MDLLVWLAAGLPRSVKLEAPGVSGALEPLQTGLFSQGEGGEAHEDAAIEKEIGQTDFHASVQMVDGVDELVALWRSEAPGLRVSARDRGGVVPVSLVQPLLDDEMDYE